MSSFSHPGSVKLQQVLAWGTQIPRSWGKYGSSEGPLSLSAQNTITSSSTHLLFAASFCLKTPYSTYIDSVASRAVERLLSQNTSIQNHRQKALHVKNQALNKQGRDPGFQPGLEPEAESWSQISWARMPWCVQE